MASTAFEGGVPLAFRPRFGSERQSTSGLGVCCCGEPVRPPLPVPAGLGFLCRPRPRHALRHTVQTRESRAASQRQRQVRRSRPRPGMRPGGPLVSQTGNSLREWGRPLRPPLLWTKREGLAGELALACSVPPGAPWSALGCWRWDHESRISQAFFEKGKHLPA